MRRRRGDDVPRRTSVAPLRCAVVRNRVLALLAAVALIVGAVVLRGVLDDDDGGTDVVGGPDSTSPAAVAGEIVCIEDLRAVCEELQIDAVIEPAGATITRLSAADADPPAAWITLAPLPQALDEARRVDGLDPLFGGGERVSSSAMAFVARTDRGAVLLDRCGGEITWRCLGDSAGSTWEQLGGEVGWRSPTIGHDAPDRSALGAVVFGWVAATYFEAGPVSVRDEAFVGWLTTLERANPDPRSPLRDMIRQLGTLDIVGTSLVEANNTVPTGDTRFTIYPSTMASAEVVVATSTGGSVGTLADDLRPVLQDAGWEPTTGEAPATVPGLPPGPVIEALRTNIWPEVS